MYKKDTLIIKNRNCKSLTQAGFSAFELIGALVVLAFLIIVANQIINNISKNREYNQLADQSKNFSQVAIKYLEDNYRYYANLSLTNNDMVISYAVIESKGYVPTELSSFTKNKQVPCVYVTTDSNNFKTSSIRAYLIFGNTSVKSKNFSGQDIANIAREIGGNAGALVEINGAYEFKGGVDNDLSLSTATMNTIASICGFITPFPQSSLIIDLSKNQSLFASIKGNIDRQSTASDEDPSLKKSGAESLTTMQTNLYLDNIYQESFNKPGYRCTDPSQADIDMLCTNYANQNNWLMNPGSAELIGVTLVNQTCQLTAHANFSKESYSCDGVLVDATNYCPSSQHGETIVPGSGYWNPDPPQYSNGQCISTAYAYYKTSGVCDGPEWWIDVDNPNSRGDLDSPPNWQRAVTGGKLGQNISKFISCAVKQPDDNHSMVHCPGTYNQSTGLCDISLRCRNSPFCISSTVNTSFAPTGGGKQDSNLTSCGQKSIPAKKSTINIGTSSCGIGIYPAESYAEIIPPQHLYRALDFGQSQVESSQRIQIKANAPSGPAVNTSELNVINAGLQADYFAPNSHTINSGTVCKASELGKIAQDLNNGTSNYGLGIFSQLQCMYNPTFCNGGYCYLPIKNSSFTFSYSSPQSSGQCPVSTIVDHTQPDDGINISVGCPNIKGWNLFQSIHGVEINCYQSVAGTSFCQGYQTVCSYLESGSQQDVPVNALSKLKCTNAAATFTVDNYKQQ